MNFLTGIKPTGVPHLGNYFSTLKPALKLAETEKGDFFYFIADLHALTAHEENILKNTYQVAATWLALGLDPNKINFYRQSDVPEIFELSWILSCFTPNGDLKRAHAYKAQEGKEVNAGLFTYPILMSADILLFNTDFVPMGHDQEQHLEIARSIASRINQKYGEVFIEPQSMVGEEVATVPGLDGEKMSKSKNNTIPLFFEERVLQKTIARIKTDSSRVDGPKDPDSSLVYLYYKLFNNEEDCKKFRKDLEEGISWGAAKDILYRSIYKELLPFQSKYKKLIEDPAHIEEILEEGRKKIRKIAKENLTKIKDKLLKF